MEGEETKFTSQFTLRRKETRRKMRAGDKNRDGRARGKEGEASGKRGGRRSEGERG